MRILLISPPGTQAEYLNKALCESAHSLQITDDLRDGLYLASNDIFDAVLMVASDVDAIVSAETGVSLPVSPLLPSLLPQFARLAGPPVIVAVLDHASTADRVRLLRAGAHACFVQPYSFIEMHERMLALHRASPTHSVEHAPNVPFRLDASVRELVAGETRLPLSRREFLLIECLLRRSNAPVARDYLSRYAWPESDGVDPLNVNHVVTRLRRKFKAHGISAQLETISRFGYQLSHS